MVIAMRTLTMPLLTLAAWAFVGPAAHAEAVRFRYVPIDACGTLKQAPCGPDGALGERLNGLGFRPQPVTQNFRPNQMVTFRHPYTGRNATVPLTLPQQGTPRMETWAEKIVYNYGSYTVEVRFFPDGSVDTVYNSGFLRVLKVE